MGVGSDRTDHPDLGSGAGGSAATPKDRSTLSDPKTTIIGIASWPTRPADAGRNTDGEDPTGHSGRRFGNTPVAGVPYQVPKQLQARAGTPSLLQSAVRRCADAAVFTPPPILCQQAHVDVIRRQLAETGVEADRVVVEPESRGTAPAVTLAALGLEDRAPDDRMLVLPSGHVVHRPDRLVDAVTRAGSAAGSGLLVNFGVRPHHAETGYGYIRPGEPAPGHPACRFVSRFVEKPDAPTATDWIRSGDWLWNSGIFLFRAVSWLEEISRHAPEVVRRCRGALDSVDRRVLHPDRTSFSRCPSISVDRAVIERSGDTVVVPFEAGWHDAGSWLSLWEAAGRDEAGNAVEGDVLVDDVKASLVRAGSRLVAVHGMRDVAVIETPDAVLVLPLARAQESGRIAGALAAAGRPEAVRHLETRHPWGRSLQLDRGPGYRVARLVLDPGAELALRPDRTLTVLSGTGRLAGWPREGGTIPVTSRDTLAVGPGQTATLSNPAAEPLVVIETRSQE